jgi:long-chain acyl-CoA synthetase
MSAASWQRDAETKTAGGEIRFSRFAYRNPGALALVDPAGRELTRGEISEPANAMARRLREAGLVRGDVLAILAPNCAEYLIAYLAATQVGLYVVPLNWHLAAPELQYILDDCGARALVAHRRFRTVCGTVLGLMKERPRVLVSLGGQIDGFTSLDDFVANAETGPLEDAEVGRVLGYTSATTGKPKGVVLSLDNAARSLNQAIERRIGYGMALEEHVLLCASMLYHGAPLEMSTVALHMGHAVVLVDNLAPATLLQFIERYRVTIAYMVPGMFSRLLNLDEATRRRYSTASLVKVTHGAAPCPVQVKYRMMEWLGPIISESYGSTEGGGTVASAADWLKYPGTVGRPIPGTRLKILNDDGEEVPTGSVGTIYMTRYDGERFEYLGAPEKTRAAWRGDFFTVGDVGYVNEEGFLFICDRKIDMINVSGMKVYPAEIEDALAAHPGVVDSAVFGIPDAGTGEAVMAVVQPATNAPPADALKADLVRFLSERVSMTKIPRRIEVVPELPRDGTGKLQKRRLRGRYVPAPAAAGVAPTA